MTRSYRKTPKIPMSGAESETWDKKVWHGVMRARERDKLKKYLVYPELADTHITTVPNDVVNKWDMVKDGKQYVDVNDETYIRKWFRYDLLPVVERWQYVMNRALMPPCVDKLAEDKHVTRYFKRLLGK